MDNHSAEPIVSVRDLRTHFFAQEGLVRALDGVSFDIFAGKTLGVVGESGCGKSVMARSILRIVEEPGRIVSGTIMLDPGTPQATDLTKLDPVGAQIREVRGGRIGLIFQEPMTALSAHYTVGNQLIEVIRRHSNYSAAAARVRAIDLLADVGVPSPARRIVQYPFELSGGLRQRVGVAMALAGDPDVVIADEPTTALDVTTQAQILALLRRLQEARGIGLMLITHDMGVIAEMAQDVIVMYLGQISEKGPVRQIFKAPQHPYTRALLRSIPSIFAAPRSRLAAIRGAVPHPSRRPSGCSFHPRCPEIIAGFCERETPPLSPAGDNGLSRCFLVNQAQR